MIATERRAEDAVRFRDTAEGRRQSDALRAAEQQSGRRRAAIVADLDREIEVGHDQYRRYLRGDTPLRLDQISVFARVLQTTKAELSRALGLLDDENVAVLRERAREALGGARISGGEQGLDEMARELAPLDPATQDDVIACVTDAITECRSSRS